MRRVLDMERMCRHSVSTRALAGYRQSNWVCKDDDIDPAVNAPDFTHLFVACTMCSQMLHGTTNLGFSRAHICMWAQCLTYMHSHSRLLCHSAQVCVDTARRSVWTQCTGLYGHSNRSKSSLSCAPPVGPVLVSGLPNTSTPNSIGSEMQLV